VGWQIYELTGSAFQLGMIGLVQFIPLFLLTPIVGLVADTYDRRWIVRGTNALLTVNAAALGYLTWTGQLSLPFLFGAAVFIGIARAFSGPAFSALAPNLVPRESLPTAIAVSATAWQLGTIAGPSLGGVLYAIHPDFAYATIAGLLLAATLAVFLVGKVPQPPVQKDRRPIHRVIDGFNYVRNNRLVMAAITLDLFVVLLAGATALLPVFARDILHVGAEGFGVLAAGMGIGATAGSLWFSFRPMKTNVGSKMLGSVLVFALAILTFGLSQWFWLSLAALIVAGAADMVSVYVRQSLIQLHTPDEMRGRVGAVSALTISASNELGEAESGLMASLLGPVGAVVFGGVAAIAITLAWSRLYPELRLAKTFDPPSQ
jgi:predicted MFS family arabinose efflux permease